jgi:16S rRNA (cytosine967-C5)-methyltransferase
MASTNPREVAAAALAAVAADWPDASMGEPDISGMPTRDLRLARAIYRTAIQRWLSLVYLLDRHLNKPLWEMEPLMQGVLLSGATQLLFMDRLPGHAVVDESVNVARKLVRPGAAGLANAVLRKMARLVQPVVTDRPWEPAMDRLPLEEGYVVLAEGLLPPLPGPGDEPAVAAEKLALHLQAATSHPAPLVRQWIQNHGTSQAITLCQHGVLMPPVILSVEPGCPLEALSLEPHKRQGFALWHGAHLQLPHVLKGHSIRRVQDPASSLAVQASANLSPPPALILDLCAGRGTKTRQLAVVHPEAQIIASDTSVDRLASFEPWAKAAKHVRIVPPAELDKVLANRKADMILLDVPCSNTGVLARRPGAKYRYNEQNMSSLMTLQRKIIDQAMRWLVPEGVVVYSTCSLEPEENQDQVAYLIQKHGGRVVSEKLTLPAGAGKTYHDGSYHAVIRAD